MKVIVHRSYFLIFHLFINPLTPGAFAKTHFLDILKISGMDIGQISFNLVKTGVFAIWQLAFLFTSIVCYDILARACAEITILSLWGRKWHTCLRFSIFFLISFVPFPFSPFLFFSLTFHRACLQLKKLLRKRHREQFYHGEATCSDRKFCWVSVLTFWAFLCISQVPLGRAPWSGYHWKDPFVQQKLSIDDVNFGQNCCRLKWKKGAGQDLILMLPIYFLYIYILISHFTLWCSYII